MAPSSTSFGKRLGSAGSMASGERWSLALLGCWVQSGALDAGFVWEPPGSSFGRCGLEHWDSLVQMRIGTAGSASCVGVASQQQSRLGYQSPSCICRVDTGPQGQVDFTLILSIHGSCMRQGEPFWQRCQARRRYDWRIKGGLQDLVWKPVWSGSGLSPRALGGAVG